MKTVISILAILLASSMSQGFINSGEQIKCDGLVNQVFMVIGNEVTDSNGQSLEPIQFVGRFFNQKRGEELNAPVTFVRFDDNRFAVIDQTDGSSLGFVEDFGQLAFARTFERGSKHITNCSYREL